jgi:hypothetical protein
MILSFFLSCSSLYFLYSFIFALFSLFFNYEFLDIVLTFLYALFKGMKNGFYWTGFLDFTYFRIYIAIKCSYIKSNVYNHVSGHSKYIEIIAGLTFIV